MDGLKLNIRQTFSNIRLYIGLSAAFYSLGVLSGIILVSFFPTIIYISIDENKSRILVSQKDWTSCFFDYFVHNVTIALISIIMGLFFSFLTIILLLSNGFFMGTVLSIGLTHLGLLKTLFFLLHNIFELPAIIFAGSMGIKIGVTLGSYLFTSKEKNGWQSIKQELIIIIPIILVLLFIAAIIEASLITLILPNI